MNSPFGPESPQDQMPQIRLEDLDFARLTWIVKWILLAVILIVIWGGVTWGRTFYTDWLWFSSLGHEQVLLRVIIAKIWLFLLGALIFVVLAAPNLYAADRTPRAEAGKVTQRGKSSKKRRKWRCRGGSATCRRRIKAIQNNVFFVNF